MIDEEPMNIKHCVFCGKAVDLESESHDKPRKVRVELHYDDVYNDPEQTSKVMAYNNETYICYDCAQSSLKHWIISESPYSPCQEIDGKPNTFMKFIRDELLLSDIYGQLAEECCELAQASLKLQRQYIDSNPTDRSLDDLLANFDEEVSDVHLCLQILEEQPKTDIMERKLKRWVDRLSED